MARYDHETQTLHDDGFRIGDGEAASVVESSELLDCGWRADDDGAWHTGCGEMFLICNDDDPVSNNFRFCCYCGKALRQKQSNTES